MKKTLSIIIALVMLLSLAIPVSADADATFTFTPDPASCNAGDNVVIVISVASDVEYNSLMLRDFTYNTDVFEFVTFTYTKKTDTVSKEAMTRSIDNDKVVYSLPFEEEDYYEGRICTATFAVKSTAPTGIYTITATPILKLDSTEYDEAMVPATISVTGIPVGPTPIKIEKDATLDMSEISDSYVDASEGAVVVDERTITGSNIYVTSEGKIRLDDGEHAKISSDNGDGTTNQGFVFGVSNPVGIITVILEVTGVANAIDYTGKTVTKEFDFTGSEIYGLTNFGFAINNIPKPLEFEVK